MADELRKMDYNLQDIPAPEFKKRAGGSGYVAQKEAFLFHVNTERQVIKIVTFNTMEFEDILREFEKIKDTLKNNLKLDNVFFYEINGDLRIISNQNPLEVFKEIKQDFDPINDLNTKMDSDLSLYGIRLCEGENPDSPNWLDLQIEPYLTKAEEEYSVSIIYRNTDWGVFEGFVKNLENKQETIFDTIERIDKSK
ncbi:MAG: hypothetical protein R6U44_11635 [Archaeoglobaceae archaeon]